MVRARSVVCANCATPFVSEGLRAKWCERCKHLATATSLLRAVVNACHKAGHHDTATALAEMASLIAPRGSTSRADYLQGKSDR